MTTHEGKVFMTHTGLDFPLRTLHPNIDERVGNANSRKTFTFLIALHLVSQLSERFPKIKIMRSMRVEWYHKIKCRFDTRDKQPSGRRRADVH